LVGGASAFYAIDAIAAMRIAVDIPGVKNDVVVLRTPQRIGFNTPSLAFITKINAQPVGSSETNDLDM
jgi:hypothetical protein